MPEDITTLAPRRMTIIKSTMHISSRVKPEIERLQPRRERCNCLRSSAKEFDICQCEGARNACSAEAAATLFPLPASDIVFGAFHSVGSERVYLKGPRIDFPWITIGVGMVPWVLWNGFEALDPT